MTTLANQPNTALLVVDVQNGVVEGAHQGDAVVANVGSLVDTRTASECEQADRSDVPAARRQLACQRPLSVTAGRSSSSWSHPDQLWSADG
jgi:hypothetical protein